MPSSPLQVAVVCSSNQNRSMEAHNILRDPDATCGAESCEREGGYTGKLGNQLLHPRQTILGGFQRQTSRAPGTQTHRRQPGQRPPPIPRRTAVPIQAPMGDFDKIWREHCEDEETLCEYAEAMKNLADNHWAKTCEGEGRIEWCCSVSREYFHNGGKRKALEKDEKRAALAIKSIQTITIHASSKMEVSTDNSIHSSVMDELLHPSGKIRLLDVGSCFNPFLKFEEFLTVGIDIVPAVESVYKCDFLNLQIHQPLQLAQDAIDAFLKQLKNPIDSLPGELFHVVVFSLLLSYFPSPYQRWICCKKAHELLVLNGLLLIITPDSSHQNRHAMMMKSWKIAIESLGFKRFKYSKFSHMHLMAFRKISLKTTSDLVSRNYPGMLYIPQDFNTVEEEEFSNNSCYIRLDVENEQLACSFMELPDAPYDSDSGESQTSSIPFYELEDPILLLS